MTTTEGTIDESQTHEDWQQGQTTNREEQYKLLQSDYTIKSQKLAEYEKKTNQQDQWADPEQVKNYLKDLWFVSKEELERERQLDSILESNPELRKNAKAIEALAKAENKAYEDVIEEYGFKSKDQLSKAKTRWPMWDRQLETQTKSYKDLTPAEREARKKSQNSVTLVKGKSF